MKEEEKKTKKISKMAVSIKPVTNPPIIQKLLTRLLN